MVQTDDGIILAFAEVIKIYFGFHLHQFYNLNTGSFHKVFLNQCMLQIAQARIDSCADCAELGIALRR